MHACWLSNIRHSLSCRHAPPYPPCALRGPAWPMDPLCLLSSAQLGSEEHFPCTSLSGPVHSGTVGKISRSPLGVVTVLSPPRPALKRSETARGVEVPCMCTGKDRRLLRISRLPRAATVLLPLCPPGAPLRPPKLWQPALPALGPCSSCSWSVAATSRPPPGSPGFQVS